MEDGGAGSPEQASAISNVSSPAFTAEVLLVRADLPKGGCVHAADRRVCAKPYIDKCSAGQFLSNAVAGDLARLRGSAW